VLETNTSPGMRSFATRAPMWTAMPPTLTVDELTLTGVQAGADLKPEFPDGLGDRAGAADRARRPVEAREEAVAGDVKLCAAEADELAAAHVAALLGAL